MAYDRYDTRRGSRERWRSDDRFDRERAMRDREDRGFFERAGDEIASWFGDDDAERRRRQDMSHQDRGDYGRERWGEGDHVTSRRFGRDNRFDRDDDFRRSDDDRGFFSASSYRGFAGEGGGRGSAPWSGDTFSDRDYKPMTGDLGRGEFERPRGRSGREDFSRPTFSGSSERAYDPHYAQWRNRQLDELDRDYDEYRRENQSRFESDFGDWRSRRQGKRQMLGQVREHMEVVGSDEQHVGTVDRVAGDRIILTKSDPESGGSHHSIPCTMVDRIEDQRVFLDCDAEQAKLKWRDESRERALFEREDQGEAGPMMLDRSFSGTYR